LIAAALALAQAPVGTQTPASDSVRLRTILPNDVAILVERRPSPTTSVQLWISAAGAWERYDSHGARHLLEHLMALGSDGEVDAALETQGGFLRAETYRDAMAFKIAVPKGKVPLAIAALQNVLTRRDYTEAEIARESRILREEFALRGVAQRQGAVLWQRAYGEHGLDPFGNLETIAGTTPDDLARLRSVMVDQAGMALAIVGDEDIDVTTRAATALLRALPKRVPAAVRPPAREAAYEMSEPGGDAFAARVGSFREVDTLASIAAGLALASESPGAYFTYTPSNEPGLVIVGHAESGTLAKRVAAASPDALFDRGRRLANLWLQRKLSDPESVADFRGRLLAQSPSLRPEALVENLPALTLDRFRAAIQRFREGGLR